MPELLLILKMRVYKKKACEVIYSIEIIFDYFTIKYTDKHKIHEFQIIFYPFKFQIYFSDKKLNAISLLFNLTIKNISNECFLSR